MRLAFTLLAIWLILTGLSGLTSINIPSRETVMGILAIVSGILLILKR